MGSNGNLPFMPSRLEHRANFPAPVETVYSILVDEVFLTERLNDIGGKGAALLEHSRSEDQAAFRLRQGVDANRLPGPVRSILNGDLVVEREERWRSGSAGYEAASRVTIAGMPAEIKSRSRLVSRSDSAELLITAEIRVSIPLIGGKIEKVVSEQVGKLLSAEAEYAEKWLAERA